MLGFALTIAFMFTTLCSHYSIYVYYALLSLYSIHV